MAATGELVSLDEFREQRKTQQASVTLLTASASSDPVDNVANRAAADAVSLYPDRTSLAAKALEVLADVASRLAAAEQSLIDDDVLGADSEVMHASAALTELFSLRELLPLMSRARAARAAAARTRPAGPSHPARA